jgi:hypothetical protein
MSVAVCKHKCIGNRYIHTVTCTGTQAVFVAVRYKVLDNKILIIKETSILPFPTWREQGRRVRILME